MLVAVVLILVQEKNMLTLFLQKILLQQKYSTYKLSSAKDRLKISFDNKGA